MSETSVAQQPGDLSTTAAPSQLLDFLRDVIAPPEAGQVLIAGALAKTSAGGRVPMAHQYAMSHEELAQLIENTNGADAYMALATYTSHLTKSGLPGRQGKYAQMLKSLFSDIDCSKEKGEKGQGYLTIHDAKVAVNAFCAKTGLPPPTHVIGSGSGVHLYWALETPISADVWQEVANKLKQLAVAYGFLADPARTADRASVLRPPGSLNYKTTPPRPVRLLKRSPCIAFDTLREAVDAAIAQSSLPMSTAQACSVPNQHQGAVSATIPTPDVKELAEVLRYIDPDCDELTWKMRCVAPMARAAAAHPAHADALKSLAIAWSRGDLHNAVASKWQGEADFEAHWNRFLTEAPTGNVTTLSTIYYLAQQNGWKSPTLPLSDTGNAARLVAFLTGGMRYVHGLRVWVRWEPAEHRWLFCHKGEPVEAAKALVRKMLDEATKISDDDTRKRQVQFALKSQELARINAMVKLAESDPAVALDASQLDQDCWAFGVHNGLVDLRTGHLRSAHPTDLVTKQAGTSYDANASCPLFEQTLRMAFAGDQALIDFFQRVCGYLLFGGVREQLFFFCYGTGANGKSTILNVIQSVMGDYAVALPTETLMAAKRDATAASPDLMMLRGARLAMATETEDGHRLAESRIKQLTGGDTITARALYGSFVSFPPTAKLVMVGNHKPQITGVDVAIWRRVLQIPFEVTIPAGQRDPLLPQKLQHEMPGILAWMVRGCIAWQQQGLTPPAAVNAATAAYKAESDLLGEWLTECCSTNPFAVTAVRDLYPAYRNWTLRNGHQPWSSSRWGRLMSSRFTKGRNSTGQTTYAGIDLNPYGRTLIDP